ncbi:hypothetical protein I6J72_04070 [Corynebacterium sp. FDAARGOS 1242]|uniref:Secreted protein n=1 Tax=Corynebacterium minutissimum TaxID=38301 RepID=A0A376D1C7_9CORY|nr:MULTISPECIES: hypothetical protein [Corynebacterium]QRP61113.1 hypothetical protein I6J26_00665 [Corynebacterium minutissimum]QRP98717.1 hypothetical protein I6J72_04070 [Corynebacterium sp. FDAARGOS 1242]STC78514.1 Uncharacterised protein [Corynebacterium minutissimum]
MRRTIIALSTAAALTFSGTAVATAAESSVKTTNSSTISSKAEDSSYYQKLRESAASSNDPDLNRFYVVLLDGLIGLAAFAVIGSLYGELAKRLPF